MNQAEAFNEVLKTLKAGNGLTDIERRIILDGVASLRAELATTDLVNLNRLADSLADERANVAELQLQETGLRAVIKDLEAKVARLEAENARLRDENAKDFRMDELDAVMHSVDKWFDDGDARLDNNPATRAADAREIALKAIETERADRSRLLAALKWAQTLITLNNYKTWIKERQDEVDGWPRDYQRAIAYQAGWSAAIDAVIQRAEEVEG